jgi:centrosomal CEP192-like protein
MSRTHRRILAITCCASLALAGCSDLGDPVRPAARPELSASALDFGTVAVTSSATRSVVITNSGTGKLEGAASVPCSSYQVLSGGGSFSISPGGSVTIVLRFSPAAVGSFPCTLDLGPNCPQVSLDGSGAVQAVGAQAVVLPDSIDLGIAAVGATGHANAGAFQIFSVGTAPLLVNVVPSSLDFVIVSGGGPGEIPPGGSRNVIVEFHPQGGRLRRGSIAVGPGSPDILVKGVGTTVSLKDDVRPIFTANCNDACHAHVFMDPTYGTYYLTHYYVVPFDTTNSTIYYYIDLGIMPQGRPRLPQSEIDVIGNWIMEGAQDN